MDPRPSTRVQWGPPGDDPQDVTPTTPNTVSSVTESLFRATPKVDAPPQVVADSEDLSGLFDEVAPSLASPPSSSTPDDLDALLEGLESLTPQPDDVVPITAPSSPSPSSPSPSSPSPTFPDTSTTAHGEDTLAQPRVSAADTVRGPKTRKRRDNPNARTSTLSPKPGKPSATPAAPRNHKPNPDAGPTPDLAEVLAWVPETATTSDKIDESYETYAPTQEENPTHLVDDSEAKENLPVPVAPASPPRTLASLEEELQREMATRAALDEEARRQKSLDKYAEAVSQILTYAGRDPDVSAALRKMELTRDAVVNQRQREHFQRSIEPLLAKKPLVLQDPRDVEIVYDLAYDKMLGLGPIGPLWRDDQVTEIMVNAFDKIFVQANGQLYDTKLTFKNEAEVAQMARGLAQRVSNRVLSNENALVTAYLPGARANFVYGAPTRSGAVITIRKFTPLLSVEKLLEFHTMSTPMYEFLRDCVHARANILVSGSTDAGKTTMINALSGFIPDNQRVITIEDSLELSLANHHVVALQTKEKASGDDKIVITQAELMVNALRMRPDRVIVGEIRDGAAARVFLDAANTGHDGTMTTIHGNSVESVVNERLVTILREDRDIPDEVARRTIASALNLVIQVKKSRGRRFISEIAVLDTSQVKKGLIVPHAVFTGVLREDGPVFERRGGLRDDTDLAQRFDAHEVDRERWREDS